jgi:hypothetical protein
VAIHEQLLNRSKALWGPDAWEFKPDRWMTDDRIPEGAKEITGYRHLMTFLDGPKVYVGYLVDVIFEIEADDLADVWVEASQ